MPTSLHRPVDASAVFTGSIAAFRESSIQGVKQQKRGRETDVAEFYCECFLCFMKPRPGCDESGWVRVDCLV